MATGVQEKPAFPGDLDEKRSNNSNPARGLLKPTGLPGFSFPEETVKMNKREDKRFANPPSSSNYHYHIEHDSVFGRTLGFLP